MNNGPRPEEPHYTDEGALFDDGPYAAAGRGRETPGDRDRRQLLGEVGRLAQQSRAARRRDWVRRGRPTPTPPPWDEVQRQMAALRDEGDTDDARKHEEES